MSEQPHAGLDKLFQRGMTDHNFTYNAAAWEQMEELLDKEERKRRFFGWFWAILLLLPLGGLLILHGWFRPGQVTDSKTKDEKGIVQTIEGKGVKSRPEVANISPTKPTEAPKQLSGLVEGEKDALLETPAQKLANGIPAHKPSKARRRQRSSHFNLMQSLQKTGFAKIQSPKSRDYPLLSSTHPSEDKTFIKSYEEKTAILEGFQLEALPRLSIYPTYSSSQDSTNVRWKKIAGEWNLQESRSSANKAKWLLSLAMAGEGTGISGRNINHINWKAGLQLEYRYLHRFSIRTGINVIRKSYTAEKGDYIPPKGFWTRKIAPQAADGKCTMLEIPILLGYHPKGYQKTGFYSEMGLSSLLLLREQYQYFYDLPDPDLIRRWGTTNTNRHWLGIAHISIGYQQSFRPKFSWQIAPYLQLPVEGIGHGKVRLWSIGLIFRVNLQVN